MIRRAAALPGGDAGRGPRGWIEGIEEATITKLYDLYNWIGGRKPLALAGYGLAAADRSPLAPTWVIVRPRRAKGIRSATR